MAQFHIARKESLTVSRARRVTQFQSQPFFVAEIFARKSMKKVDFRVVAVDFEEVLSGTRDGLPGNAFYTVGDLKEVKAKATQLASTGK